MSHARPLHIVLLDYRDVTHPLAGGAEAYLNETFQRIAERGHRITLLCGSYPGAAREETVGRFRVLRVGNRATLNFVAPLWARRLARREGVDVFVENICKIPFLLPALTGVPVLAIVLHLLGRTVFYETNPAFASYVWLYEQLIPIVYRNCRFVAISESTAGDLRSRGLRRATIDIVHPGLNLADYTVRGNEEALGEPVLVYLGMLKRYKGIDVVLRAFARARQTRRDARLILIGKGNDRPRLEKLSRSLGLEDAVTFAGYVSNEEKVRWLQRARAVVYPSLKEGWGIPAMEAAACGTPTLASDTHGLRDAVIDGVTGYLIPHSDIDAWARRMIDLISDRALRDRLGEAARDRANAFPWDRQAEKMCTVVEQVARRSAPARPEI